jgi:hypothetical protein
MTDELGIIWKEAVMACWKYRGTCLEILRGIMRNYNKSLYQEKSSVTAI